MSKIEDRELLELAAKAGGIKGMIFEDGLNSFDFYLDEPDAWGGTWNSLADDGDCARLEVALEIELRYKPHEVSASHEQGQFEYPERFDEHGGDRNAARRRASTRAAAEIGRAM